MKNIWPEAGKNNYSCLDMLTNKFGVYIFRDFAKGAILYIGEARGQDLRTRIKQNLTESDSGATFRKNYMETENANFEKYKSFIKDKQIICFNLEKNLLIHTVESILIYTLKPKYNKDK